MRRKTKATFHKRPVAQFGFSNLSNGEWTVQAQYRAASQYINQLNARFFNEHGLMSTAFEGRLAARNGELVLEIYCVLAPQLSIFFGLSGNNCDSDPDELLDRAGGQWANVFNEALIEDETLRLELPGLATAATRLKADANGVLSPLVGPNEIDPALNRRFPDDLTHAMQGDHEFDLCGNLSVQPPVWELPCTVRAQPRLARNGINLTLIEAPSGHSGKKARVNIGDVSRGDLQIIAGAAHRRTPMWLEVQLATSPGRSRVAICKVLGVTEN